MLIAVCIYWFTVVLLFYVFMFYPFLLVLFSRFLPRLSLMSSKNFCPSVSLIIAAYNEEKMIAAKLENTFRLSYPAKLVEIIVASDCSTDQTEELVRGHEGIKLCAVRPRGGKTNAQNQAAKLAGNEIICFSDANSLWQKDALMKLVQMFADPRVAYVCGQLKYYSQTGNNTRVSEGLYWRYELVLRALESRIYSVTGGNGGIYAIRREEFVEIDPFYSHDLYYPQLVVKKGRLALYAKEAVAWEKSGDNIRDEFSRRVRMLGRTWLGMFREPEIFNLFKRKGVYTLMFFTHRFLRYLLPFWLIMVFSANWLLAVGGGWYLVSFLFQLSFYFSACLGLLGFKGKIFFFPLYLTMFAIASLLGLSNVVRGRIKPYWEQSASTRE